MLANAFTLEGPEQHVAGSFFQVAEQEPGSPHPFGAVPYINLRRNIGTLSGFTPVPIPTKVWTDLSEVLFLLWKMYN